MRNITTSRRKLLKKILGRFGKPRTEAERKARHKKLYGNTNLPPRGTGRGI